MHKPAETSATIHPLLASRWSPRCFDEGADTPPEIFQSLKEAARWAPSCYGAEPWRFVFCDRAENREAWDALLAALAEPNQAWAKNAQLLVLVCAETHFEHNGKPNRHCQYDAGAAAILLVLEAENQGLRCHQMGGFDPAKAADAMKVPEGFECMSVIAVGAQSSDLRQLPKEMQERENAPRSRQPLETRFFNGEWGGTL